MTAEDVRADVMVLCVYFVERLVFRHGLMFGAVTWRRALFGLMLISTKVCILEGWGRRGEGVSLMCLFFLLSGESSSVANLSFPFPFPLLPYFSPPLISIGRSCPFGIVILVVMFPRPMLKNCNRWRWHC